MSDIMMQSPAIAKNIATRALGSGGAVATEEMSKKAFSGDSEGIGDVLATGAISAPFGALGQAGADVAVTAAKTILPKFGRGTKNMDRDAAAESLLGDARPSGTPIASRLQRPGGVNPTELFGAFNKMEPGQIPADVNSELDLKSVTEYLASLPGVASTGREARAQMVNRLDQQDEMATAIIEKHFGGAPTKAASADAAKGEFLDIGTRYQAITDPQAAPILDKDALLEAFSASANVRERAGAAHDKFEEAYDFVKNKLGTDKATGEVSEFRPVDLINAKKQLDEMISPVDPAKAVDKDARSMLIDMKNDLNDFMRENIPGYAEVAAEYAEEAGKESARRMGSLFMKPGGWNKADPSEFKKYYDGLSMPEKTSFGIGVMQDIQRKAEDSAVKKLTHSQYVTRLETVFGKDKVAAFLKDADTLTRELDTAKGLTTAMTRGAKTPDDPGGVASTLMDIGSLATASRNSGLVTPGTFNPARRVLGKGSDAQDRWLFDMLTDDKAGATGKLFTLMDAHKKAGPRMYKTGQAAAVGGSSGISSLLDERGPR